MTSLTISTWNVLTLMDNIKTDRPERRTALVARELDRYNIHIAALSGTRFANEGQLTEVKAGYTFFWSGRSSEERREAGAGLCIRSSLVSKLTDLSKSINDRLMILRLPIQGKPFATFISAYASTITNPEEIRDKFYEDLENAIEGVPKEAKLILPGASMLEWAQITKPGRESLGEMVLENATETVCLSLCITRPPDHQHSLPPAQS